MKNLLKKSIEPIRIVIIITILAGILFIGSIWLLLWGLHQIDVVMERGEHTIRYK